MPSILGSLGTQYDVMMVTKLVTCVSSNCGAHLVEYYRKSNILIQIG